MLQQTQVARVIPKFEAFIAAFPDERTLAAASLADVLRRWQGLGYNRRAKYLHDAAKMIVYEWGESWPTTTTGLQELPGVGPNTAGAIAAFSFNQSAVFVETNIRTVYFLHYFPQEEGVKDTQVREVLERTIDAEHPREYYWAVMDYGSFLKAHGVRNNSTSRHYKRQSALEGSVRQVRGQIIAMLAGGDMTERELRSAVRADDRFDVALTGVMHDGLVSRRNDRLHLTK
jgi:A/G-specific adenine glycosylase